MKKREIKVDEPDVFSLQFQRYRGFKPAPGPWSLAEIRGGIEKFSLERRGRTIILKIVSPEASLWEKNWTKETGRFEEPKPSRQNRKRHSAPNAEPA